MRIDDSVFTTADIAHLVKVARQTVTSLIRRGRLRGHKAGKDYRVSRHALKQTFPFLFEPGGPLADQPSDG